MKEIYLYSVCSISNGGCKEDCSYCAQSSKHKTGVEIYNEKPLEQIMKEAQYFSDRGAHGLWFVTAGKSLGSKKTEYLSKAAKMIKKKFDFHLIACCGIADEDSLRELKNSGIDSYNHNLETSKDFFQKVCTTHTWDERYTTCENAANAGLSLFVGGIMGIGESWKDRETFCEAVRTLNPFASTINFFIPKPLLPIKNGVMDKNEAIECIKLVRGYLPESRLIMAGGRELVFGKEQKEIFDAGIDAIITGGYPNACGQKPTDDIAMLKSYELGIAKSH